MKNLRNLHGRLGPKRQNDGPSRGHGWIGAVEKRPVEVSRALDDVWEPVSGRVIFFDKKHTRQSEKHYKLPAIAIMRNYWIFPNMTKKVEPEGPERDLPEANAVHMPTLAAEPRRGPQDTSCREATRQTSKASTE